MDFFVYKQAVPKVILVSVNGMLLPFSIVSTVTATEVLTILNRIACVYCDTVTGTNNKCSTLPSGDKMSRHEDSLTRVHTG